MQLYISEAPVELVRAKHLSYCHVTVQGDIRQLYSCLTLKVGEGSTWNTAAVGDGVAVAEVPTLSGMPVLHVHPADIRAFGIPVEAVR
jgi:hypothetical protein